MNNALPGKSLRYTASESDGSPGAGLRRSGRRGKPVQIRRGAAAVNGQTPAHEATLYPGSGGRNQESEGQTTAN